MESKDRDVDTYKVCLGCIEATWKHSDQTFDFKKVNVATVIRKGQFWANKTTG